MKPLLLTLATLLAISEPSPASAASCDEVKDLTALVYHEDRENALSRTVVDVVLNRVQSPHFPNTVCGVIHQPAQFSFWTDIEQPYRMPDTYSRKRAERVATLMLHDFHSGQWQPLPQLKGVVYYVHEAKLIDRHGKLPDWVEPSCAVNVRGNNHTFYKCHKNA